MDIIVVLDRSGSMTSIKDDTIGGFNEFLAEQKKVVDDSRLTLVQFDHEFEVVYDRVPIQDVAALTTETFIPRGSTALLDAIGRTLNKFPSDRDAVCVIITDGHENCSREFSNEQIKDLIKVKTESFDWSFVYLGANQDAFAVANAMGISGANTSAYVAGSAGVQGMYSSVGTNVSAVRSTGNREKLAFTDDQRTQMSGDSKNAK